MSRLCTVPDCTGAYKARGFCKKHYTRLRSTGQLDLLPPRTTSVEVLLSEVAVSYRQLDYWARHGYLKPDGGGGSGFSREWPAAEREVARQMAALISAGLTVEAAHRYARRGRTEAILAATS